MIAGRYSLKDEEEKEEEEEEKLPQRGGRERERQRGEKLIIDYIYKYIND
jgi:hypothetical protein